jgi:hypothetical protein
VLCQGSDSVQMHDQTAVLHHEGSGSCNTPRLITSIFPLTTSHFVGDVVFVPRLGLLSCLAFEYTLAPDPLHDVVSGIFGSVDMLDLYAVPHRKRKWTYS